MNYKKLMKSLGEMWLRGAPIDLHTFMVFVYILMDACSITNRTDMELLKYLRGMLANIKGYKKLIADHDREVILQKIDSAELELEKLYKQCEGVKRLPRGTAPPRPMIRPRGK